MNPSTRIASLGLAVASAIVLSGCASSLSGVGGSQSYACKAPIGSQCTSVSGVYANASANASTNSDLSASRAIHEALRPQGLLGMRSVPVPPQRTLPASTGAASTIGTSSASSGASAGTAASAATTALRSPPRVLRLWISPWEDADGDLHEASFINVVIDTGRWLIERVRPAPRSRIDIATPPLALPATPTAPAAVPETRPAADLSPVEP